MQNTNNPFDQLHERLDSLQQQVSALVPVTSPQTEIINRSELCKRLNITEPTCIRWQKKGRIPVIRIGSSVRYNWPAVISALETTKIFSHGK